MPILKINDLENTYNFTGQGLTKNKNGLFLNPIGTGRLYRWDGDSKKENGQELILLFSQVTIFKVSSFQWILPSTHLVALGFGISMGI